MKEGQPKRTKILHHPESRRFCSTAPPGIVGDSVGPKAEPIWRDIENDNIMNVFYGP